MKIDTLWRGGVFGLNKDDLFPTDLFGHISHAQALSRLRHILYTLIPPDNVGALLCIEPTKAEAVGAAIISAERRLWRMVLEAPDALGWNADGISFASADYPILVINVERNAHRWNEYWTVMDYIDMGARYPRRGGLKPWKPPLIKLRLGLKQY